MSNEVTKDTFKKIVLESDKPVLVDFWAPWCGPCQMLTPTIDEVSKELADEAVVVKVNVDDETELAGEYGVMSIPSLKLFKGGEIVAESLGVKSKDDLIAMIRANA